MSDNLINDLGMVVEEEEKIILKNEIDLINEKNKEFIYYTKDYFLNG